MPAPGMLTPFSVPGKKSFFAVPPPGKPLEFPFFVLGWKGACLVLKAGFALCGVRPGEKGEGFFLSRGEWYQGSNPQEVGPGGGLASLGRGRDPPTFATPRGVVLKKGTFPFTFFWFFSLCNGDFFSNTKKNCRRNCFSIQCQLLLLLLATHTCIKELFFLTPLSYPPRPLTKGGTNRKHNKEKW